MIPVVSAILAGLCISSIAALGYVSLLMAKRDLSFLILLIVPFAAGSLLGGAFFDLIPESFELAQDQAAVFILFGIIIFYLLDHALIVYHAHAGHRLPQHGHDSDCCPTKPLGIMNLLADALHNMTDGFIIASAFMVSPAVGISASVAVALHEIPQEIGDFGILIHSGYKKFQALWLNLLVAASILLGIGITFLAANHIEGLTAVAIPLAAGGFIYMSLANLFPEMREEHDMKKRFLQIGIVLIGMTAQWGVHVALESFGLHHEHGHEIDSNQRLEIDHPHEHDIKEEHSHEGTDAASSS